MFQEFLEKETSKKDFSDSFGSQKGQVEFLINNICDYENKGLPFKKYFIDCAAGDGITHSNTLFLERELNWKGLLVEPNPYFHDSLKKNRVSEIVKECIGSTDGQEVEFRIDNKLLAGIVGEQFDNNHFLREEELKTAEIINLKTRKLETILDENNAPKIIDYLSLDVEGAEEFILSSFNFKKYKFKFMTIERPTNKLNILLDQNNYVQVKNVISETFYMHKEFISELNHSPQVTFNLTKGKDW